MLSILLHALFWAYLPIARAAHNITVDDGDPSITYAGQWETTPYDPLNAGGSHRVTINTDATATFTFTGTAIYFYSPLWPFRVTTSISLDGQSPDLLDLRDHSARFVKDGPETTQSQAVWSQVGLEDTVHTLFISVGPNEDLAVIDTLVYTVPDLGDPTDAGTPPTSTSNTRLIPVPTATTTQAASTSSETSKKGLSIALGIVCTVFGILVLYGIFWYWRRRRRLAEEEAYLAAEEEGNESPEMSEGTTARPSFYRSAFLRNASRSAAAARANKGNKRRRPPAPPPRRTTAAAIAARRAKQNPLTTIEETSYDAEGRPMSIASSSYHQSGDGRRESLQSVLISRAQSPTPSHQTVTSTGPGARPTGSVSSRPDSAGHT